MWEDAARLDAVEAIRALAPARPGNGEGPGGFVFTGAAPAARAGVGTGFSGERRIGSRLRGALFASEADPWEPWRELDERLTPRQRRLLAIVAIAALGNLLDEPDSDVE